MSEAFPAVAAQTFFSMLGLAPTFDIDPADLERRYFALQRQFHPDRFIGKPDALRQQAIRQSMLANEAYETLKSPLRRARYLLAIAAMPPDGVTPSQALLTEIMELREALAEAASPEELNGFIAGNIQEVQKTLGLLLQAFDTKDLAAAAELTMRLSYLTKLEDEIRVRRRVVSGR